MDYHFLKQKTPRRRVKDVSGETSKYSLGDEQDMLDMSKNARGKTFLLVSVGHHEYRQSELSSAVAIRDIQDIYGVTDEMTSRITNAANEDAELFWGMQYLDVSTKAFYSADGSDSVYIQIHADIDSVTEKAILAARDSALKHAREKGYDSAREDSSFIDVSGFRFPLMSEIPELTRESLAKVDIGRLDTHSRFGICHLYHNGSCIAAVELDGNSEIMLTHPVDGVKFNDIDHAKTYTFGVNTKLTRTTLAELGPGAQNQTDMSYAVQALILNQDNQDVFSGMISKIAENNSLSLDHAKNAFWDLVGGQVYGNDLRMHESMKNLFLDVVHQLSVTFPQTKPITDLWMTRYNDLANGTNSEKMIVIPSVTETPEVQINSLINSPKMVP